MNPLLVKMRKQRLILFIYFVAFLLALNVKAQDKQPLRLVQKISMPGVHGILDHVTVDVKGKRLFIPANSENQNTVEVIDVKAGKWISSIPGQSHPQGTFYSAAFNKLFVANGTDGTCKIFSGDTFRLIKNMPLGSVGTNANQVGYDPETKYLYVGTGDKDSGSLAIVDTSSNEHIGDIKTDARPGWITFENSGPRIFMNLSGSTKLAVIDKSKRQLIETWPIAGAKNIGPLVLDEGHHRLFVGTREPPMLIVFDTASGKQITQLDSVPTLDGLWYDSVHKRIYATGDGAIAVYDQKTADDYTPMTKVLMERNAQPSIWVPEFNRLYISIPETGDHEAEVLVYEP
jgi:DNA-binding beta-propeller fold protein YncE